MEELRGGDTPGRGASPWRGFRGGGASGAGRLWTSGLAGEESANEGILDPLLGPVDPRGFGCRGRSTSSGAPELSPWARGPVRE